MDVSECWSIICEVDVSSALEWLSSGDKSWSMPSSESKPQRIFVLPMDGVFAPIIDKVLSCFAEPVSAVEVMLSRMKPGQRHSMHDDKQLPNWITRVHVPLVTNPMAWLAFEEEGGEHVHFEVGNAYTFNTLKRHAFGNEGETERVHLLFDVMRAG